MKNVYFSKIFLRFLLFIKKTLRPNPRENVHLTNLSTNFFIADERKFSGRRELSLEFNKLVLKSRTT